MEGATVYVQCSSGDLPYQQRVTTDAEGRYAVLLSPPPADKKWVLFCADQLQESSVVVEASGTEQRVPEMDAGELRFQFDFGEQVADVKPGLTGLLPQQDTTRYRPLYARYQGLIGEAAGSGDEDQVLKITERFNDSVGGRSNEIGRYP